MGGYFAFAIPEKGQSANLLHSGSPTGIGGTFQIPRSFRWGVVVFMAWELDQLCTDLANAGCPELVIYDWDSKGTKFSASELSKIKTVKSLRRLDCQLHPAITESVVRELASLPNLEEIWLPASGGPSDQSIAQLRDDFGNLKIERGVHPSGENVGERVKDALKQGR